MVARSRSFWATLLVASLTVGSALGADLTKGMKKGTPELKSAGPLAFGPQGILFAADPQAATVFAIDTKDRAERSATTEFKVEGINQKIASLLGTAANQVRTIDLAVNPASGSAYISVARGRGPDATPVLVRVTPAGKVEEFSLKNVSFSQAPLPNAPGPDAKDRRGRSQRVDSITDIAFVDGKLLVAGLSNEEFASNLRSIPFPFSDVDRGANVRIFHGSHGRFETNSPVRTFVSFEINGDPHILAAYTCTPLVKIPMKQLKPGSQVKGTTIAELGNRNRPLDMIVYEKDGKRVLLLANSNRGIMKITTKGIGSIEGITQQVRGAKGLPYETIGEWKGVMQLDRLDDSHALVLVQRDNGAQDLLAVNLP